MVVDIGGGTTENSNNFLGGVVESQSLRIAGDEFDDCIRHYMRRKYNLVIGPRTAEEIKIIGSVYNTGDDADKVCVDIRGRDMVSGLPITRRVTSIEVRESLEDAAQQIMNAIKLSLERCPPELSADLVDRGIALVGGGSQIRGFDALIREKLGLPVILSESPMLAVCLGNR